MSQSCLVVALLGAILVIGMLSSKLGAKGIFWAILRNICADAFAFVSCSEYRDGLRCGNGVAEVNFMAWIMVKDYTNVFGLRVRLRRVCDHTASPGNTIEYCVSCLENAPKRVA